MVLVDTEASGQSVAYRQISAACRFYGLGLHVIDTADPGWPDQLRGYALKGAAGAVAVSSGALSSIDYSALCQLADISGREPVPFLVFGVTAAADHQAVQAFSRGVLRATLSPVPVPERVLVTVGPDDAITRELREYTFSLTGTAFSLINTLQLSDDQAAVQHIISFSDESDTAPKPVFVKIDADGREVFYQAAFTLKTARSENYTENYCKDTVFELLPLMMFLRYVFGDRCWHAAGDFANLTIDDPWLIEPYGFLSYTQLLAEMQKADFHTTIAFIPWNFDCSREDAAALFRRYPERFSICIHGSEHQHREFGKYDADLCDPKLIKSNGKYEHKIKLSLARMEKFRELTGIPYDRVMVFPHGIAPAGILGLLKQYNFLSTCNSRNIPFGAAQSPDPFFSLRSVTTQIQNFASFIRYPARAGSYSDMEKLRTAVDLFLDNPLLFYAHHDFFSGGADAFNKTAAMVNGLQPDVAWQSLESISRGYYLQRLRGDGNYDVYAFTPDIVLANPRNRPVTYFVTRQESFCPPVQGLTVDGRSHPYRQLEGVLFFEVTVPPGKSIRSVITYLNDADLTTVDVAKRDIHTALLRWLSNFRDLTLSRNAATAWMVRWYYQRGYYEYKLKGLVIIGGAVFLLIAGTVVLCIIIAKKKT